MFVFAFEPQFSEIGKTDSSFELMIIFAAIQGLMNILAERRRVNIIEQIYASDDVIVLPKGLFGLIGAVVRSKFSGDDILRGCLVRQRQNYAGNIFPFLNDKFLIEFADWFYSIISIMAGMFETVKRLGDSIVNVFEARRKLVTE